MNSISAATSSIIEPSYYETSFEEPTAPWINVAQITRISIAALAALAILEIVVQGSIWGVSFALSPIGLIVIPTVLAAILIGVASYYVFTKLSLDKPNYQDADTLSQIKAESPKLSFYTLYKKHGLENLVKHIFNEPENPPLSLSSLCEKFKTEATYIDFELLTIRYDLTLLKNHNIISEDFFSFVANLKNRVMKARQICAEDLRLIDEAYHLRSKTLTRDLKNSEQLISGLTFGRKTSHISTAIDRLTSSASIIPSIHELSYEDMLKKVLKRNSSIDEEAQREYQLHCRKFFTETVS